MTNKTPQWEKEFDEKFIWFNKEDERDEFYEQDVKGVKAFIKQQLEELIDSIPHGTFQHPNSNDIYPIEVIKQQLRDKYLKGDNE